MKVQPLRLGIVGCGRIARAHLDALADVPAFELTALCDVNASAALQLAPAGARVVSAPRDLASCVDAAIICVPPTLHATVALELLECGIHVLCEKPLAPTLDEARAMLAAARRAGRVLGLATKFRYAADVMEAKRLIESGTIGEVRYYFNKFLAPLDLTGRWNADPRLSGGGVLMDNGPHAAYLAHFLIGAPRSIQAGQLPSPQGLTVDDEVHGWFETERVQNAYLELSWHRTAGVGYVTIIGREAIISLGWKQSALHPENEDARPFGNGFDKRAAFARNLQAFANAIAPEFESEVLPPLCEGDEALATVAFVAAAYESFKAQNSVPIAY